MTKNKELTELCFSYYARSAILSLVNIVTSITIIVVNYLLKRILRKLAAFQRFSTVTDEVISSSKKIFTAMFLNTTFVPMLANLNLFQFNPGSTIIEAMGGAKGV